MPAGSDQLSTDVGPREGLPSPWWATSVIAWRSMIKCTARRMRGSRKTLKPSSELGFMLYQVCVQTWWEPVMTLKPSASNSSFRSSVIPPGGPPVSRSPLRNAFHDVLASGMIRRFMPSSQTLSLSQ